jgi:hypothetical protein
MKTGPQVKKHNRRGLAALLGGTLIAAAISVPATAEAATAPAEVKTIPGDAFPAYATDQPTVGGVTGFLHQRTSSSPWLWTRYSDRRTTVVDELEGRVATAILPAGGDSVFVNGTAQHQTLDLNTMSLRTVPEPHGTFQAVRVFGNSRVTIRNSDSAFTIELHQIAPDGTTTPTPTPGVPDGLTDIAVVAGDATTAVVRFVPTTGDTRFGLLDVVSGQVTMLATGGFTGRVVLTDDRVALMDINEVRSFSRAGVVNGTDTAPDVFTVPGAPARMGLAGEDLIVDSLDQSPIAPIVRYRPDGTPPTQIVALASHRLTQVPDGVLFVGGTGPGDWSVRKASATGESTILPLHEQVNAGVTVSSGVLRHIQAQLRPGETPAYSHTGFELAPNSSIYGPGVLPGVLTNPLPCETGAVCVRTVDGNRAGTSYLSSSGSSSRITTTTGANGSFVTLPSIGGTVVDASRNYQIVNGTNSDQQYIIQSGTTTPQKRPVTGAALWFSTLWSATSAGYLQSKSLTTGRLGAKIPTGSDCAATEVQATGNHLYWSCGRTGPSGIYVIASKTTISLPGGQYLLGDNYVVRHDADGALLRYDLTGGTLGDPATMATFPRGSLADDRNITWAVDKFGGDVAWVDGDNTTHIVDPGVTPSPLQGSEDEPAYDIDYPSPVLAAVNLTRPVSSTAFTVKELRTGQVTTFTGGPARTVAGGSWDLNIGGRPATRGTYQWALSATVDGTTTKLTGGTVTLRCTGTQPLHSYDCSARPNLLGLTSAATGAGQWLAVEPGGQALVNTGSTTEALTPITAIVPFGDITKDGVSDLLIRRSSGALLSFRGANSLPFAGGNLIAIPGNWNQWDALIHSGDLTSDGQADLIARDRATGGLYRIDGDGAGGFKTPVLWATGYKGYTRFVGPGDINGDGHADLILFVGTDMFAKYGDGKGGLGDRHLIGSGFLGYDAIVGAGDLNEDGKNDLVLRDTAGNLYRRLGNGAGDFGNRLLIGTGYQKYASIY